MRQIKDAAPPIKVGDAVYRVAATWYDGENPQFFVYEYAVKSLTPRGYRITTIGGASRVVLTASKKKFTHSTKLEALEEFVARKKSQVKILESQLTGAKKLLEVAEDALKHSTVAIEGMEVLQVRW